MKKLVLALAAVVGITAPAAADVIQIGNLFYNVQLGEGVTTPANIVANPDGSLYSGTITIPDSVLLPDGTMRMVNKSVGVFNTSDIEELIVDMNPFQDGRSMNVMLRYSAELKRIQVNKLVDPSTPDYYPGQNFNVGENQSCVHYFVRPGETENKIVVDRFNLYGPDGKQLKPVLMTEGSDPKIFYPEADNTFILDKDWRHDGEYCAVLPLTMYTVVVFGAMDENGNITTIRADMPPTHTGLYAYDGAFTYEVSAVGAALTGATEGATVPDEVMIPENVEFEGVPYPVTRIGKFAFRNLEMKSVSLPATVDSIFLYGFENCPNLETVDLSATKIKVAQSLFSGCPKLTDVKFPEGLSTMRNTFYNCEAIEHVDVPSDCKAFYSTFNHCPSIKEFVIPVGSQYSYISLNSGLVEASTEWINGQTLKLTISNMGIKFSDGSAPEYYPYTLFNFSDYIQEEGQERPTYVYYYWFTDACPLGENNEYALEKAAFYYPENAPAGYNKERFYNSIYIGTHENFDLETNNRPSYTILATLNAPEPTVTGILAPEVIDTDAPVQYFNLQGMPVQDRNLTPGIYIRRQGSLATKILIK